MKTLSALDTPERLAILDAWVERLDTRHPERQGRRRLRDSGDCLCALGELADEVVGRGYASWEGTTLAVPHPDGRVVRETITLPGVLLGALGVTPREALQVSRWNDLGERWPEIARRMLAALGLA